MEETYPPGTETPQPPRIPVTCDAHIDIPWVVTKNGAFNLSWNNEGRYSDVDFPRMRLGWLQSAVFALYLSDQIQDKEGREGSLALIMKQIRFLESQKGCTLVEDPDVAVDSVGVGVVPIFLGLEGGRLIYNDLALLGKYRQLGVRYLTVTHNRNTDWADSATDKPYHNGLTLFGAAVVKEAGKLGILMDVSHGSDDVAIQILRESTLPVIASHSGCKKLVSNTRNLTDELIKGIAATNGVVCVPFARRFVGERYQCVVDHIDHICQLVGSDYVGVGSDLDGADMVDGADDVTQWKKVVLNELSHRGFSDDVIADIAGMNLLRVLKRGLV